MKRRTLEISGLNISMHAPHSEAGYVELFYDALRLRTMHRVGTVHMLMLGSVYPETEGNPDEGLRGEIFRFVHLDPNQPWLNSETNEMATGEDLREVRVPSHLLPHLQRFPFVFRPRTHHFYYIKKDRTHSIGPAVIKQLLDRLFSQLSNSGEHPETNVTVIPDEQTIDLIFNMPTIESLSIEMTRPNPDDGQSEQARWEEKLRNQGIKKLQVNMQAAKGERINADEETRTMAEVASINGKVLAIGRDLGGRKVRESTEAKPLISYPTLISELEITQDVLAREATTIDERLR